MDTANAVELVCMTLPKHKKKDEKYYRAVTKEFEEYARVLTLALRQEVPKDEGNMDRSIKWKIDNRDKPNAVLRIYVGNKSRPEVSIRSVLYGRKGFSAKKKNGVLRFRVGGETIYTRSVKGAKSNDWFSRGWKQTTPHRNAIEDRLDTELYSEQIDVSDYPGAVKITRVDQMNAPKVKKHGSKKRI